MTVQNWALAGLGASVTVSSVYSTYVGSRVMDANDSTEWRSNGGDVPGEWMRFDLGEPRSIEEVYLLGYYLWPTMGATEYLLQYSHDDNVYWTAATVTVGGQTDTFTMSPITARYWKLLATAGSGSQWRVFTLELRGEPYSPPSPPPAEVESVLSYVWTTYGTTVLNWGLAHGFSLTDGERVIISLCSYIADMLVGASGGGECEGATADDVQTIVNNHNTTIVDAFSTQTAAMIGLYDALVAEHEATRTAIGVSEGNVRSNDDVNTLNIRNDIAALDFATQDDLDTQTANINLHTSTEIDAVEAALGTAIATAQGNVISAVESEHAGTVGTITAAIVAARDVVTAALAGTEAALLAAIGDVLSAIGALVFSNNYPGDDDVSWGSSVPFTGTVKVLASASGPSGEMDGIAVTLTYVPPTKGAQEVQGVTNYKYLGWLLFLSEDGFADEIQWLGPGKRVYLPKQLTSPAAVVLFARDATEGIARPFTID